MKTFVVDRFLHIESQRVYEADYLLTLEEKKDLQAQSLQELDMNFKFIQVLNINEIELVLNNKEYSE